MRVKEILQGWGNLILQEMDLLSPEVKQESTRRLLICDSCPMRVLNTCSTSRIGEVSKTFFYNVLNQERKEKEQYSGCGCNISAKTLSMESQCPLGKWETNTEND